MKKMLALFVFISVTLAAGEGELIGYPSWKSQIPGSVSSLIISDDGIFVGSVNGSVYLINNSGVLKWSIEVGSPVTDVFSDGRSYYFSSQAGQLYSVNVTGDLTAKNEVSGFVGYPHAFDKDAGLMIIGSMDGSIQALNASGHELWSRSAGGYIIAVSILNNSVITVTDRNIIVYNVNGSVIQDYGVDYYIRSAALTDEHVALGLGDGRVIVYDTLGGFLWSYKVDDQIGPIFMHDERVVTGTRNKGVYCFLLNGSLAWNMNPLDSVVSVSANRKYVSASTLGGRIFLYSNKGDDVWSYPARSAVTSMSFDRENLVVGLKDGFIMNFRLPRIDEREVYLAGMLLALTILFGLALLARGWSK